MGYVEDVSKNLYSYLPPLTKRDDFDDFWRETIEQTQKVPLNATRELVNYPSPYVKVYDITYNGFDETPIHGWYLVPNFEVKDQYPCLIHYHGFGGDRATPTDFLLWVMMGISVVSIDCRMQKGITGDFSKYSSGAAQSMACRGILDKNEYYFRKVYMDCVKAIDFACNQPEVDDSKIIIEGGSQGGALGMAVCALDERPFLTMVDVPSNSNLEKRVEGSHGAFSQVTDYLKTYPLETEKVFETLSYFDTMNMADKIKCPVLASVGLKDPTCPAEHYFATYNRITAPKEIRLYPFNGHEGGGRTHRDVKMEFLMKHLGKK